LSFDYDTVYIRDIKSRGTFLSPVSNFYHHVTKNGAIAYFAYMVSSHDIINLKLQLKPLKPFLKVTPLH